MPTKIDRRSFLKVLGLGGAGAALAGCDRPSYATLEEGEEQVFSYLAPEEYVVPGIGVWYASTCLQCPAGCGVHGRVREGRALKLEGNPDTALNKGKLCQMGQAALQTHYNPDRITKPRIGDQEVTWPEALAHIQSKSGGATAWLTGAISGHQAVLLDTHLHARDGGGKHYAVETVNAQAWQAACADTIGDARPELHIDKANSVLSFGADFLGTWISPVKFMADYGAFRSAPRGVLTVIEPAMTLSGANADHWVAARPGSEAAVALGVAYTLASEYGVSTSALPSGAADAIANMTPDRVMELSGVEAQTLSKIAATLMSNSPSLVIGDGRYETAAAAMALNMMLGNIGATITPGVDLVPADLAMRNGSTKALADFAADALAGRIDSVFITGANPAFTASGGLKIKDALANIPLKIGVSMFEDETTQLCDVVLPLASPLEDWGTHVPSSGAGRGEIHVQQPLMEKLHPETLGLGDILLGLAQDAGADGLADFEDYYGYLRTAVSALIGTDQETAWQAVLQAGKVQAPSGERAFTANGALNIQIADTQAPSAGQLTLITTARQGLYDGRHANLPWLQEAPDQISKAVWDSWAEIHPKTAAGLGLKDGDYITITSSAGAITTRVFLYKGVHPDAIAVPMGRGHTHYGRYATGIGVNPLSVLDGTQDVRTGEFLATASVRVQATGDNRHLVRLMDVDQQYGRKLAVTISADQHRRNQTNNQGSA
ncbi:molybdopterin dinucleotide binding domain-containing protein [Magnetovibrio sp.]|uniref:molybdopterin dinucleotide binding domain-containing protein n=1 Tax=Magnetovibrio sp. TaxID=2024836 RepID=UPI002F937826